MIDWGNHLLGKEVIIHTLGHGAFEGKFEGMQPLGPFSSPFIVLKLEGDDEKIEGKYVLIPEQTVERIYIVSEPGVSGENGEGSGAQ